MIKKYRPRRWKKAVIPGLTGISIVCISGMFFGCWGWKQCLDEKRYLEEQLDSYSHMVYVAAERLPRGTVLSEDLLNLEIRHFDLQNLNLISDEVFGKSVICDIEEGVCLTTEMLGTECENSRELFLSEIKLKDHVQTGDRIDIRIRYENAEDYTVLADKIIKKCDTEYGIVLELTEEEILFISSAFADQKKYEGTSLYVARYPGNSNMAAGNVNYIPNREILSLLGREKTEGESRNALEERLMQKQ